MKNSKQAQKQTKKPKTNPHVQQWSTHGQSCFVNIPTYVTLYEAYFKYYKYHYCFYFTDGETKTQRG
jgi:hypothetical protein